MVRRISEKLKLDTEFIMGEFKNERKEIKIEEIEEIAEEVLKKSNNPKQLKNQNPVSFGILVIISGIFGLLASSLIINLFSESLQNQSPSQERIKKN